MAVPFFSPFSPIALDQNKFMRHEYFVSRTQVREKPKLSRILRPDQKCEPKIREKADKKARCRACVQAGVRACNLEFRTRVCRTLGRVGFAVQLSPRSVAFSCNGRAPRGSVKAQRKNYLGKHGPDEGLSTRASGALQRYLGNQKGAGHTSTLASHHLMLNR